MRLRKLILKNFGPFKTYELTFVDEEGVCVLLTGKNNEGKSTILNAIRLLDAATRVVGSKKQEIRVDGDYAYKLLVQDTENLNIGRMIYNYADTKAEIHGVFGDGLKITVYLDPSANSIYADNLGRIPSDGNLIFGFIPPLGPLSENEDLIAKASYLRASVNTSLAPRHLRNHLYQSLSDQEFGLVRQIIKSSWEDIELLKYEIDPGKNRIYCYYRERRFTRELSWAGQGLQVWFQIITHLVRLRNTSILILDEPEINLHPEKQNDLIRILRDYHAGSILIATHSVELMNSVHVSHIINVKKQQTKPQVKSTADRSYLELVRSQVGSNFNFIASQFEDVDLIVFTEETADFKIIDQLARGYGIAKKAFNIPLHGFSEYPKSVPYKNAYELLIGGKIRYSAVLDRDYYPDDYLEEVRSKLGIEQITTIFTPGKEIENVFLYPSLLRRVVPSAHYRAFETALNGMFDELYLECYGSFMSLHEKYLPGRLDIKTIIRDYVPKFVSDWSDQKVRFKVAAGKPLLKLLRGYFRDKFGKNLSEKSLIQTLLTEDISEVKSFVTAVYHSPCS